VEAWLWAALRCEREAVRVWREEGGEEEMTRAEDSDVRLCSRCGRNPPYITPSGMMNYWCVDCRRRYMREDYHPAHRVVEQLYQQEYRSVPEHFAKARRVQKKWREKKEARKK
jgi:hypothetical protein